MMSPFHLNKVVNNSQLERTFARHAAKNRDVREAVILAPKMLRGARTSG